jgi:6-bladed beta-propeller
MNKKILFKTFLIVMLLAAALLPAQEFLEMPKPTHTVKGVPTSTLELIKEIDLDRDKDLFFAGLWDIKVNKNGWLYVYDAKLFRMFIFDDKYRYVGQFLDKGEGPGEINSSSALSIHYHPARDGNIYVTDSILDRFLIFSPTGKFIEGKRMYRRTVAIPNFTPVPDKNGFIYGYSTNDGIVDKLDLDMKCVHTFLDSKLNEKFVIFKPYFKKFKESHPAAKLWKKPGMSNAYYAITPDDRLFIYLFRSSTAYLFKGKKLERKFEILIDRVMPLYKKEAEKGVRRLKNIKRLKGKAFYGANMFASCLVDQDEPYFYLNFSEEWGTSIFKFDLKGNLVRIIKNESANIRTKVNGLFYGISFSKRNPVILKEK